MVLQVKGRVCCVGANRTTSRPSPKRNGHASLEELGVYPGNPSLRGKRAVGGVGLMLGKSATQKLPHLVVLLSSIILCAQAFPVWPAESRLVATVPALSLIHISEPTRQAEISYAV